MSQRVVLSQRWGSIVRMFESPLIGSPLIQELTVAEEAAAKARMLDWKRQLAEEEPKA